METSDLSVFCYECDEFVINDTQDRFLENLRTLVLTKKLTKEAESETPVRSLRARRKRSLEPVITSANKKQKSSKKENRESEKKTTKKRIGLKNLGNTCFMNSVLQSLSNIEEFCNVLTTLPSLNEQIQKSKDTKKAVAKKLLDDGIIVTDELKKVLSALIQSEEKTAISPECLFQAIWQVVPRFKGYQQQDAHEFLRYTLDRLHTELLALLPGKLKAEPRVQSNSLVTSVFGGTLQS